ncbi:hypothetical protein M2281_002485 [Mesorhizobium soli]|uniref:hypothetical protein n=1 Tax=Pseudaminobacter soli (ex Li et al. 2025) TaxID=1295366 RepID=UPI0024760071|nr:hypothetical protein [Mesorhizobium soli]MDH6231887.1 hypothetical protein [Mesorhizobium soli]
MSSASLSPTRRELLGAAASVGAISLLPGAPRNALADEAIRPFTVNVPQAEIDELRRRISATLAGRNWLLQEVTARLPGRLNEGDMTFTQAVELEAVLKCAAVAHGIGGQRDEN